MPESTPLVASFDRNDELQDARYVLDHAENPLAVLRALATLRSVLSELRQYATLHARANGHSWAEIAEASKTTRQQEHRKYADAADAER